MPGIGCFDSGHAVLEQIVRGAAVAFERELHVVRRDRIAVVKCRAVAQHEIERQSVLGFRPGFRKAGRHRPPRHRLHHGVVQRVEHHERRNDARDVGRVEPDRGERDVHRPGQLPVRGGRARHPSGRAERRNADAGRSAADQAAAGDREFGHHAPPAQRATAGPHIRVPAQGRRCHKSYRTGKYAGRGTFQKTGMSGQGTRRSCRR